MYRLRNKFFSFLSLNRPLLCNWYLHSQGIYCLAEKLLNLWRIKKKLNKWWNLCVFIAQLSIYTLGFTVLLSLHQSEANRLFHCTVSFDWYLLVFPLQFGHSYKAALNSPCHLSLIVLKLFHFHSCWKLLVRNWPESKSIYFRKPKFKPESSLEFQSSCTFPPTQS